MTLRRDRHPEEDEPTYHAQVGQQSPMPGVWRRLARWLLVPCAAALVVDVAGPVSVRPAAFPGPAPLRSHAAASPVRPVQDDHTAERAAAVRRLLATRARAVLARDRTAFLRTVDPARPTFRRAQRAMFDALATVPLATWRYDVDDTVDHAADLPLPRSYRAEVWAPEVTLRYRLAGFDPQPAAVAQRPTFVRRGRAWYLAADDDFAPAYRTARSLWDFGPVDVVRGRRSLVLGHPGQHLFLQTLAAHADAAVPAVTRVWGADWPQRLVVLVPQGEREMKELLGDDSALTEIAAVAVAELQPDPAGQRFVGNRIVVHDGNFRRLGPRGRQVVLTHEATHVASREASAGAVPAWLVEGFADYVGYRDSGLRVGLVVRELATDVRAGRLPTALPADGDFVATNPRLAQAYELSWLACRLLADRLGEAGLVGFYRDLGRAPLGDRDALSRTLRRMLHTTPREFTRAWVAYVRQQIAA